MNKYLGFYLTIEEDVENLTNWLPLIDFMMEEDHPKLEEAKQIPEVLKVLPYICDKAGYTSERLWMSGCYTYPDNRYWNKHKLPYFIFDKFRCFVNEVPNRSWCYQPSKNDAIKERNRAILEWLKETLGIEDDQPCQVNFNQSEK